jgi:hypothetical protein
MKKCNIHQAAGEVNIRLPLCHLQTFLAGITTRMILFLYVGEQWIRQIFAI